MSIRESMQATTATWRVGSTWRPASGKLTANARLAARNSSAIGMWSDMVVGLSRGSVSAVPGCPGTCHDDAMSGNRPEPMVQMVTVPTTRDGSWTQRLATQASGDGAGLRVRMLAVTRAPSIPPAVDSTRSPTVSS